MKCLYILVVICLIALSSSANKSVTSQIPNQQQSASANLPNSLGNMKVPAPPTLEAKERVKSFRIPPSVRRLKLRNVDDGGIMDKTPIAIVGRYYL